jgi:hypothetical protein
MRVLPLSWSVAVLPAETSLTFESLTGLPAFEPGQKVSLGSFGDDI